MTAHEAHTSEDRAVARVTTLGGSDLVRRVLASRVVAAGEVPGFGHGLLHVLGEEHPLPPAA